VGNFLKICCKKIGWEKVKIGEIGGNEKDENR
jgi:hypothetical protein